MWLGFRKDLSRGFVSTLAASDPLCWKRLQFYSEQTWRCEPATPCREWHSMRGAPQEEKNKLLVAAGRFSQVVPGCPKAGVDRNGQTTLPEPPVPGRKVRARRL